MSPDGKVRGGRGQRERCLGWVGALMLCVVLAAAGMPAGGGIIADGARIEACHERADRVHQRAVARTGDAARQGTRAVTSAPPRPRPRAQTIEAGGLPPPRAPTV
jgi:hypothetical protein